MTGFAGAVLTGGASRRMGRDKALLVVDGRPLAETAAAALRVAGADDVLAVGGDEAGLGALGMRWIPDPTPGEGPLGGIRAALAALAGHHLVVVLACDLPRASAANVVAVVEAAATLGGEPGVAVPVRDGRREWLHACWTAGAGPVLDVAWAEGERAPRRSVGDLRIVEVVAPEPDGLADADRPSDLADGSVHGTGDR